MKALPLLIVFGCAAVISAEAAVVTVTSQNNYTFLGDTTYYVTNGVTLSGVTTFEGGAVIKYAIGASLSISNVNCKATPYRPVIFTAKDDNTVGNMVNGSSGNPGSNHYANPALNFFGNPPSTWGMTNFRIAYAQQAISASSVSMALSLYHGQLVNCLSGINIPGQGSIGIRNLLFANVQTAFNNPSYANFDVENTTFGGSTNYPMVPAFLIGANGNSSVFFNFVNCVFANLSAFVLGNNVVMNGSNNGFYNTPPSFGSSPFGPPSASPFQHLGAGNYYLNPQSGFQGVGTPSIDGQLASDLQQKTTQPPLLCPSSINTATTWVPVVPRDTSFSPDLGYHYDPLDYLCTQVAVKLYVAMNNGVQIGMAGRFGFSMTDINGVTSQGLPGSPTRMVWYTSVQEQPVALTGYNPTISAVFSVAGATANFSGAPKPWIILNFTDIPMTGLRQYFFLNGFAYPLNFNTLSLQNCTLRSVNLSTYLIGGFPWPANQQVPTATLWNNRFERSTASLIEGYIQAGTGTPSYDNPLTANVYNNLFWNSTLGMSHRDALATLHPLWKIADNLFDTASAFLTGDGNYLNYVTRSNDGFYNTDSSQFGGTANVLLNSLSYAPGPLGPWYLGSSSPSLVDAGSRSAEGAGLFAYTTQANQTEEGCTLVDIGFHFVALDGSGNPQDNNGNGIPDYLESLITVASPQNVSTCMNTPVGVNLSGSSPCSGLMTYTITTFPAHGTLSGTAPNLTYTPAFNYIGNDSFAFTLNDGLYTSTPATVAISVTDSQPTADPQSLNNCMNTQLGINLTGSSQCNEPLNFNVASGPSHGTLNGTPPNLVYTPNNNYVGNDSFTFTATDGVLTSSPATISITVNDFQPTADPQSLSDCMNMPLGINLTGSSQCSEPLTFNVVSGPSHGTLSGISPNLIYVPNHNYVGNDSFTFTATDGVLTSSPATISITVSDVQPVADPQSLNDCLNTPLNINLTGSSQCSEPLTFNVVSGPSHGILSGTSPNLAYMPNNNYVGNDSFTFTASDGLLTSTPATISITILGPVITAQPQSQTVCAGATATFSVTASGSSLAFQWRKDGTVLSDGGDVSGSSTATLTIHPVSSSDVGIYDVVVTEQDTGCSIVSAPAYLAVGPYIIGQTMQQTVTTGSSASFSVTALGTGLTYQWSQSIDGGLHFTTIPGATASVLTVSPAQNGNQYRVQVNMPGGGGCSATSLPARSTVQASIPDGTVKWIYRTTPESNPQVTTMVDSSPAIGTNGTIYVHSTDTQSGGIPLPEFPSRLRALNTNGTEQWAAFLGAANNEITSTPSVASNSTIYAAAHSHLFALDPAGNRQWLLDLQDSDLDEGGAFSPAIGTNGIYAGVDENGSFFGITPAGNLEWPALNQGELGASPSVGPNATVFYGLEGGTLVAALPTGQANWTFNSAAIGNRDIGPSPTIGKDGTVYFGPQAIIPPSGNNGPAQLWLFQKNGNTPIVLSSASIGLTNSVVAPNGAVYIVDTTGTLFAIDKSNGSELWESDFGTNPNGNGSSSSPAIGTDGTVYYGSGDGNLYAVLPPTQAHGQPTLKTALWPAHTGGPVLSSPVIGADGTVYVGSNDGNVYAVAGTTTLAPTNTTEWPMFRKNANHTAGY